MANATIPGGGGGKIKSVGLTMPGEFSVANSPLTASGTLAVTKVNQNANLVYAGPTTGIAAQPTFRSIVAADLPAGVGTVTSVGLSTNAAWLTVGSSPITTSGTITLNSTTGLTANQVLATPNGGTGAVSLRALVAADIPSLPASQITTGQLALARGGTNADLSATGAANSFLKQSSSGAAITVGTISASDITTALTTPPAIGATTPAAGTFTTVRANTTLAFNTATFGTNNKVLINPYNAVDNAAVAQINVVNAAHKGLVIQGFTSQSANLQEWQNSIGNAVASIGFDGRIITASANINIGAGGFLGGYFGDAGGVKGGFSTGFAGINFYAGNQVTTNIILVVRAIAAQSANLQEWQTSTPVTVGSISAIGVATHTPTDTATATVTNALVVDHSTSGTPATSYGTGIAFQGQSSTTASQAMGRVRTAWTTATHASRVSNMILSVYNVASEVDVLTLTPTNGAGIGVVPIATDESSLYLYGLSKGLRIKDANGTFGSAAMFVHNGGQDSAVVGINYSGSTGNMYSATRSAAAIFVTSSAGSGTFSKMSFYTSGAAYTAPTEGMRFSAGLSVGNGIIATDPGAGNVIIEGNLGVPVIRPRADSTTALKLTKADGTTAVMTVDTTNSSVFTNGTVFGPRHIVGQTSAPSIAAGTGAGGSPTVSLSNATDLSGIVNVLSGTLPLAANIVVTITFAVAYGVAPNVILMPANAATALLSGATMVYVDSTTTTFTINAGATGLVAATQYKWTFVVIQ